MARAVNRLAPGLRVEALAPDGLVEAFSVEAPGLQPVRAMAPRMAAAGQPGVDAPAARPSAWPPRNYRDRVRGPLPA
jgi:putative glutamine amidotransferase